jgi:fumarate reductase subunit D
MRRARVTLILKVFCALFELPLSYIRKKALEKRLISIAKAKITKIILNIICRL